MVPSGNVVLLLLGFLVSPGVSYTPNPYVKQIHSLPHLSQDLTLESNDFEGTQEYVKTVIVFPILVLALAVLLHLCFVLVMISRICCKCGKCAPELKPPKRQQVAKEKTSHKRAVFVMILLLIVADLMVLYGNQFVTSGVSHGLDGIKWIKHTSNTIINDFDTMLLHSDNITYYLETAVNTSCPQIEGEYEAYMNNLTSAADDALVLIEPIPDSINTYQRKAKTYAVDEKDRYIWYAFGLALLLAVMYLAGLVCASKLFLQVTIPISYIISALLCILCCVVLVLLMILADICMDPDGAVKQEVSGSSADLVSYYLDCAGTNPMDEHLVSAYNATATIEALVDEFTGSGGDCEGDATLMNIYYNTDHIETLLDNDAALLSCGPVQEEWRSVVHTGLCDDLFRGIFVIWTALFVVAALLYIIMVTSSVMYQYFGRTVREFLAHVDVEHGDDLQLVTVDKQSSVVPLNGHASNGHNYHHSESQSRDGEPLF